MLPSVGMSTSAAIPPEPELKLPVREEDKRRGRPSTGLYPEVSRTLLAEKTGYHISSVAGILQGRTRVSLKDAVTIAMMQEMKY